MMYTLPIHPFYDDFISSLSHRPFASTYLNRQNPPLPYISFAPKRLKANGPCRFIFSSTPITPSALLIVSDNRKMPSPFLLSKFHREIAPKTSLFIPKMHPSTTYSICHFWLIELGNSPLSFRLIWPYHPPSFRDLNKWP
jgi:hypothetical protein